MTVWRSAIKTQALCVGALIYDDSGERIQVFVAKRAETRRFLPGAFELPSGRVRLGEDLETALRRIIKEKLHVDLTPERVQTVFCYFNSDRGEQLAEILYLARLRQSRPQEIMLTKSKYAQSRWVSLETLESTLGAMKVSVPDEYQAIMTTLVELERRRQA